METLSPRLAAIAENIQEGSIVADIGTDHAYLPIYLVSQGICPKAVGGDLNKGPYQSALNSVINNNLQNYIDIRLGNGLKIIKPGELDTIVIAGMGGSSIIDILTEAPDVVESAKRLILQPMIASGQLRLWLAQNSWYINREQLVRDDNRIYEIIVAEQGKERINDILSFQLGPRLLEDKPPLLKDHLSRLLAAEQAIYKGILKSTKDESKIKSNDVAAKIKTMKKVMECL